MGSLMKRIRRRLIPFRDPVLCWRTYCSIPLVLLFLLTLCILDVYYLKSVPDTPNLSEVNISYLRENVPLITARISVNEGAKCEGCIDIVIAATGAYLKPLLACMNSIQLHTKRGVYFHLLVAQGEGLALKDQIKKTFPKTSIEIVEFNLPRVRPLIKVWQGGERHSNILNHARLYLADIFPTLDVVIYLDPDTIVVDDIGIMYDQFVTRSDQTKYFSAVVSKQVNIHSSTYDFLVNCNDVEVRQKVSIPSSKYFNAGVFVTDLKRWRQDHITQELENWLLLNTRRKLWNWGSQAPLSLVFYGKWIEIDSSWNERRMKFYEPDVFEQLASKVRIYHFAGDNKPWKNNGQQLWHLWCKYYPNKNEIWFCRDGTYLNLLPSSALDFSYVKTL
jgi:lipopolysaccharide biosynthesis glycosyltransferase